MASFLELINTWWLISNSKEKFHPNSIGNAIVEGDVKPEFFNAFADWIEEWSESPAFTLTPQTATAIIRTLRAQSMLVKDLLSEGYEYILVIRFQSDLLERRFSQYRQMSGGLFLVSLREVLDSEKILACRSLVMEDIDFWNEDLAPAKPSIRDHPVLQELAWHEIEIRESSLDDDIQQVATSIAGYISMKLGNRSKCSQCKSKFVADDIGVANNEYLEILSRGGLTTPSESMAYFVGSCFATFLISW